jgi:hypothetical protein
MLNFIIFLLATIGSTLIVTQSYVFKPIRNILERSSYLGKFIKCNQCVGFHLGIIIQFIILMKERGEIIFYYGDLYYIIYGFIGSFACYLIYLLIKPLVNKYD